MSQIQPAMSIVITTYNRASFLTRSIGSALAQTLEDVEIIVIDDASTDDTTEVLATMADDRVRTICLPANAGPAGSCNAGIEAARSDFLLFLDSDDALRANAAERLLGALMSDEKIGMAWARRAIWDHHRGTLNSVAFVEPHGIAGGARLLPAMLQWTPGSAGLAVRREVFDKIGKFDPELCCHDLDLAMRFATDGRWEGQVVREVLYDYFLHGPSVSNRVDARYVGEMERLLEKHKEILKSYPAARASFHYRAAHASHTLSDPESFRRNIDQAIRIDPFRLKYRAYKATRNPRLAGLWTALAGARTRRSIRLRKRRGEQQSLAIPCWAAEPSPSPAACRA